MRKVTADELLSLGSYEQVRDRFRARIIAHKRDRRVFLGGEVSVLFEDHDTVMSQVQEMLRSERISSPSQVAAELDAFNDLVPDDGGLLATLMIETTDPAERDLRRNEMAGIDDAVTLELGEVSTRAEFDPLGRSEGRTAVVRYLRFALPADARRRLLDMEAPAVLRLAIPGHEASVTLSETTRRSLAEDLDPSLAAVVSRGA